MTYAAAESGIELPGSAPKVLIDHHRAHACTAFLTSPFPDAAILVCDSSPERELSVWTGDDGRLDDRQWPWQGPALASLYSACARVFGFAGPDPERQLEAVAHLAGGTEYPPAPPVDPAQIDALFWYERGALHVAEGWQARLGAIAEEERRSRGARGPARAGRAQPIRTAGAVQRRLGELLLEVVADIRTGTGADRLCLAGGLFYNTCLTTLVSRSGVFREVFVPINPGNAGISIGAALAAAAPAGGPMTRVRVSPFLGREYDAETIKNALDGCKLSYSFASDSQAVEAAAGALARGQLVGWFQGRMEWGRRALGHRSILANPASPYVLDNLNGYLRKRERWRAFGISVPAARAGELLCGPPASSFMEFEYTLRDDRLRHVMPPGASSIRVQTVRAEPDSDAGGNALFSRLLDRMEQTTGAGALVNTSLNGFHEPIARSPLDAVRVFYGTGLDMLVIGPFILRK